MSAVVSSSHSQASDDNVSTRGARVDGLAPSEELIPAPAVTPPNIFPIEWRLETPKLAEIYDRAKGEGFNPAEIPWNDLDPAAFSAEQRVAIMYWWALLANFDASGPAVFARAMIRAFEVHEEDPVRKCFFSITRDETNHEECCQRVIQRLVPGGPLGFEPRSDLDKAAINNIQWLYHNGGRYWSGFNRAVERYPLAVLFTSFMLGEVASSSLFHGMSHATRHPVFERIFRSIGRDESRHLQICITLLEKEWPGLNDEYRSFVTKQLRAGFVFLSMVLWEPPVNQFWELPDYFLKNHRVLLDIARDAGLGVLTVKEQEENWRLAIARVRKLLERWNIEFPAIPELDIEGIDVGDITSADIIPVF
jgi:rubrerythrin